MAIRTQSEKCVSAQMLERQMRNWEIARTQNPKSGGVDTPTQTVRDFVTISRSVGLSGAYLAKRLHDRLGWPVYDRGILLAMAGDDVCRAKLFEVLDEREENWVESFMRGLMQPNYVGREAYFEKLVETVAMLSRTAPGIFIGRGVDLILPHQVGLRVRLSANREFCARAYSKDRNLSIEAATREIDAIERDRARYIKQNFHVSPCEAERFDLVINLERFTIDEATEIVEGILRSRGIGE